jgi:hypothetical protein
MRGTSNVNSLSTAVVEAVAAREDVSPLSLSPPLASFVDPDALDLLFNRGSGAVTFDAWGYRIVVSHDGTVEVTADPSDDGFQAADDGRSG